VTVGNGMAYRRAESISLLFYRGQTSMSEQHSYTVNGAVMHVESGLNGGLN